MLQPASGEFTCLMITSQEFTSASLTHSFEQMQSGVLFWLILVEAKCRVKLFNDSHEDNKATEGLPLAGPSKLYCPI